MIWDKIKTVLIVAASSMIIIVHAPPILTAPIETAVAQMRQQTSSSTPYSSPNDPVSLTEPIGTTVKKLLK